MAPPTATKRSLDGLLRPREMQGGRETAATLQVRVPYPSPAVVGLDGEAADASCASAAAQRSTTAASVAAGGPSSSARWWWCPSTSTQAPRSPQPMVANLEDLRNTPVLRVCRGRGGPPPGGAARHRHPLARSLPLSCLLASSGCKDKWTRCMRRCTSLWQAPVGLLLVQGMVDK